jgi:hypothetical protein
MAKQFYLNVALYRMKGTSIAPAWASSCLVPGTHLQELLHLHWRDSDRHWMICDSTMMHGVQLSVLQTDDGCICTTPRRNQLYDSMK